MTGKLRHFALTALCAISVLHLSAPTMAEGLGDGAHVPHIDDKGRAGYQAFSDQPPHRAFAIAPGGIWAWVSGSATEEVAGSDALAACRQYTQQPCHLYAVNDQVVLDETAWVASWNLRMDGAAIAEAPVGTGRGNRFPDLALTAPDGRAVTLSDLRGKPVFLHFWGSWCPPCQSEFKDLQKLYNAMADDGAVTFVLVQGREPIARSRRWTSKHNFTMPLYDSGHRGRSDKSFRMADGVSINDRRLASSYPTTYVLDANGMVVFHQAGAGERWEQYEGLLRHITAATGR